MTPRSRRRFRLATCTEAGSIYALCVFAVGVGLGTMRVLLVAPRLGATVAVLLETPIMLAVSWIVSKRVARWYQLRADINGAVLMGVVAFVVLMLLELAFSMLVFGKHPLEYFAGYLSVPGAIGLAAQFCFAAVPLLQSSGK